MVDKDRKKELFSFKGADIAIGGTCILKGFNWTIIEGQHTWLTGPNASGKTTLCKAMAGRCNIVSGSARPISIDYSDIRMISFTDDGKLFHSVNNVHYYQQRFNSWDADGHMTARDYLTAKGIDLADHDHLDFLKDIGLWELLDSERIKLSSGQTRKLLLASGLLSHPTLLILDNLYIGLDHDSRSYLNTFLDTLVDKENVTLVLSGQASILPSCISNKIQLEKSTSPHGTSNLLVEIRKVYEDQCKEYLGGELLSLKDVSISYGPTDVLNGLDWTVNSGERWAIYGSNGSGKSTIVSMIYADHPQVYSQDISVLKKRLGPGRSIWDIKSMTGFTSPELHSYFRSNLTAEQVVWTGVFDKFEIMGEILEHYKDLSDLLFRYYHLESVKTKPYHQLATGIQRLCLLMRALIKSPRLLLLDEPFQGLDPFHIELSKQLIDGIIQPTQALIFISHFDHEIPSCVSHRLNL